MNTKTGVALGSLILLTIVALILFGLPEREGDRPIDPAAGGPLIPPGVALSRFDPDHPMLRRMLQGEDGLGLYRELVERADGESLYLAAELAGLCAGIMQQGSARFEAGFLATLKPDDPNRAARLDAFRRLYRPCAGLSAERPGVRTLPGRDELVTRAAGLGYLPAIVELRKRREAAQARADGAPPADAWVIEALQSGDALAMNLAVARITERPAGYTIVGRPVDPADRDAAYFAWRMLVCESGYPCGLERPTLAYCAYSGVCNAASFEEIVQRVQGMQGYAKARIYKLKIAEALKLGDYRSIGLGEP